MGHHAILNGNSDDVFIKTLFGQNNDLDDDVTEDLWIVGGTRVWLSTAQTHSFVSTSTSDTAAGVGARTVFIEGLDANHELQSETITMNGTTPVVTANSYINVHIAQVFTAGSTEWNVGTITGTSSDTSDIQIRIAATAGASQLSHYAIPAGYQCFLVDETLSSYRAPGEAGGSSRVSEIRTYRQVPGSPRRLAYIRGLVSSTVYVNHELPIMLDPTERVWYTGTAAQNNTANSASYQLFHIRTSVLRR